MSLRKGRINPNQKRGHVWLRNRIIEMVNNWDVLQATVTSGYRFFGNLTRPKNRGLNRLIIGVGKNGKAIMIYPYRQNHLAMPIAVAREMCLWESKGALVGCAVESGDAFDIVVDDPASYKRKKRTYLHRHRMAVIDSKYERIRSKKTARQGRGLQGDAEE